MRFFRTLLAGMTLACLSACNPEALTAKISPPANPLKGDWENNGIVFKHVWIVYDTDDFPAENIDMVAQLCEEYSTQGETIYHAVWSNQCVELWYLLHFMYMDTDIDRSRYWPKLSDWLKNIGAGSYEKNRPDMYEVLRPYMDIAIANAKRLDKQNEGRKPSESAPGTKVYELVEMLRPYLLDTQ